MEWWNIALSEKDRMNRASRTLGDGTAIASPSRGVLQTDMRRVDALDTDKNVLDDGASRKLVLTVAAIL